MHCVIDAIRRYKVRNPNDLYSQTRVTQLHSTLHEGPQSREQVYPGLWDHFQRNALASACEAYDLHDFLW